MAIQPIVVGVDGSEGSKRALRWAVDYARLNGAPVEALTFWEFPASYGFPISYGDIDFHGQAVAMLEEVVHQTVGEDAKVERKVQGGPPAVGLVNASEHAQLIVVGSRGHGGFTGLLMGSVSHHCVQHAKCPVLVIPDRAD